MASGSHKTKTTKCLVRRDLRTLSVNIRSDDFQYAAGYLIDRGYTSPQHLSISGGSNGGLLCGVCLNQAPELYGAVVSEVGVHDMLRFHKFTIGSHWVSDYGNPDESREMFEYIKSEHHSGFSLIF